MVLDYVSVCIRIYQAEFFHLILDSDTLRDIGCLYCRISVIGCNQFVQLRQPCAQGISIVKGSLGDAVQHPFVGIIVVRRNLNPVRHAAFYGQVNRTGGTCDKGAGHIDSARFRQGLLRSHSVGGQELLVRAGAAQGPIPQAFVLDDLFLAAAGDDVDIPGGTYDAAHIHHPLVSVDVIVHPGGGDGNNGVIVSAGFQIRFQIGKNAVFVGSGVQPHLRAAVDLACHRHLAGAVHIDIVLGHNRTDNPGIYRAVHLTLQGMVVISGEDNILRGSRFFIA